MKWILYFSVLVLAAIALDVTKKYIGPGNPAIAFIISTILGIIVAFTIFSMIRLRVKQPVDHGK